MLVNSCSLQVGPFELADILECQGVDYRLFVPQFIFDFPVADSVVFHGKTFRFCFRSWVIGPVIQLWFAESVLGLRRLRKEEVLKCLILYFHVCVLEESCR